MSRAIRRVALFLGLAFLALVVNLNVVQLGKSTSLTEHPGNRRKIIEEYATRRGEILAGNEVLAESVESKGNEQYRFHRRYPERDLFGHITGYYSFYFGSSGLERSYNETLLGREPSTAGNLVDDLLGREPAGNIISLTIDPELQRLARKRLAGQRGAVAAIDSETGAVLALYANPTYDPNPLSVDPERFSAINRSWNRLVGDRDQPLVFGATQQRYPPGSTFKIVVAAAGLENGVRPSTTFPDPSRLNLPDTNKSLPNFQGGPCVGGRISMETALRVSCNTTFAQIAMRVGDTKLARVARGFGLERPPDIDLPGAAASCIKAIAGAGCDAPDLTRPGTAYSGIGQQDVRVTPLQMAIVAATVGNGGYRPTPYLVDRILAPDGGVFRKTEPIRSRRIYSARSARELKAMMIGVVRFGTGGVVNFKDAGKGIIGGKTGTAQTGIEGESPHVWFVAFGPGIAVAVVVENGGDYGDAATGGKVAGPIAKAVLERAMTKREG